MKLFVEKKELREEIILSVCIEIILKLHIRSYKTTIKFQDQEITWSVPSLGGWLM